MSLKLPYHHQKNCYFCGPTSLKMVFETFGVKKTEKELAQLAGTTEKVGTSHEGMIDACKKIGFSCFVHENSNLNNVKSFLKLKLPVITDWTDEKSKCGHYNIITEIGREKIFFYDPWYGPKYFVDKKFFEKNWNDSLTKGRRWIMVVLPGNVKIRQEIKITVNRNIIVVRAGRIYKPLCGQL